MAYKAKWHGIALPKGVVVKERSQNGEPLVYIRFTYEKGTTKYRPEELIARITDASGRKNAIKLAADKLEDVQRKIRAGTFRYGDEFPESPWATKLNESTRSNRTIAQALAAWTKTLTHKKASNTVKGYKRDADRLAKDIGQMLVTEFKVPQVEALVERLCLGTDKGAGTVTKRGRVIPGKPLSSKRVRNLLIPLSKALSEEVKHEVIPANPIWKTEIEEAMTEGARHYEREKPDPFDMDERAALLAKASAPIKNLIIVWIGTGMSAHEILAVTWRHIDLVHGFIEVKQKLDSDGVVRPWTKNKYRLRNIRMTPEVRAAIIAQKEHSFLTGEEVFPNPVTGKRYSLARVLAQNSWETLCRRAGVRYRGPNQCRHTYAADGIDAGKSDWQLASEMGHNGPDMVRRHYGSWIEKRKPSAPVTPLKAVA